MAEGWAKRLSGGKLQAYSAGTHPGAQVNPHAIAAMKEKGIDISGHYPKTLFEIDEPVDLIVAVCSQAAESCPAPPAGTKVERWDLPDPAAAQGTDEEIRAVFRESRDEIERRVRDLVERL